MTTHPEGNDGWRRYCDPQIAAAVVKCAEKAGLSRGAIMDKLQVAESTLRSWDKAPDTRSVRPATARLLRRLDKRLRKAASK